MANNPELEAAFDKIRELMAAEHGRGERDMMARMHDFLQVGRTGVPPVPTTQVGNGAERPRRSPRKSRERAPAGAVRALVERVLRENKGHRTGPKDIHRAASTPVEKMVSYSGIRFELAKGVKEGRYAGSGDRWSIREEP